MSEFQYYEFVAIDRPLSATAQKRLRAITSRSTITSTRLVNTYEWGDFKADPHELVAKYFDAFFYYSNWGTRRLMLRIPSNRLDPKIARQYCAVRTGRSRGNSSVATVTTLDAHLVIDLWSEDESDEDWEGLEPGVLSTLVPIRNELMAGDHRALYLAWRLRGQAGEIKDRARTPPVPRDSDRPTGSQTALVEFLRIDMA
ncbi:MAG: hypothetical protein ACREVI_15520 [Steroidobacteraceae bacterium]